MKNDQTATVRNETMERWLRGIPYEVSFWNSYYNSKRRLADLFRWSCYGKACELDNFDVQSYVSSLPQENPVVVDLGCALSYAMGNLFPAKPGTRVDYVDALAPFYNDILRRHAIDRPDIRFGMVENVSAVYDPGTVDLIHVRNALDHCADPMKGIVEALACLRVGGVLYLNHFRDEALNEGYRGFHQWNICLYDNGCLRLWNNSSDVDVASVLGSCAEVVTSVTATARIVAVIRKKAELPPELYSPSASAHDSAMMLIATVSHFHKFGNAASYQWLRFYGFLGHKVARILPYSLLHKVKALIGKK